MKSDSTSQWVLDFRPIKPKQQTMASMQLIPGCYHLVSSITRSLTHSLTHRAESTRSDCRHQEVREKENDERAAAEGHVSDVVQL